MIDRIVYVPLMHAPTRQVVVAANAYAGGLLPTLADKIRPVRSQGSSFPSNTV